MQLYHEIEKSKNMLIISLNMHEIMNNRIEIDFARNPLSDLTGESLMVKNIEFSYHEIITRLLKKGDFRRKWPLTFDLRSRSLNLKRKIGDTIFLVAWTQ